MKKLILLAVFVLMFTACTQADDVNSHSGLSSQELVIENNDVSFDKLRDILDKFVIEDILHREKLKNLSAAGITVSLKSCEITSFTQADAIIEFTKGDYSLTVDTVLDLYYKGTSDTPQDVHLCGITAYVDGSQLLVTHPFGVEIYSAETLEHIDTIKVFSDKFKLIDSVKFKNSFLAIYTDGRSIANLIVFDENGRITGVRIELKDTDAVAAYKSNEYNQKMVVSPRPHLVKLNDDEILFTAGNTMAKAGGNLFKYNMMYRLMYPAYLQQYFENGDSRLYIIANKDNTGASAFVMKDGISQCYAYMPGEYASDYLADKNSIMQEHWSDDNQKIILKDKNTDAEITFDFKNGKVWLNALQGVIENNLRSKIADSPDGRYSLWEADGGSGGDNFVMDIYLVENRTGLVRELDTIGGMYGGNSDVGFFSNGDVYTMNLEEFKVFTPDISRQGPAFEMSKNFPLGDDISQDIAFRHLLAVRRDPASHSWTVLYNESKYYEKYEDYFVDYEKWSDNFYKSTYKVAILDPQGNLAKVYDTGEHVMSYWFRRVRMYMEPGDILHFSVLHKNTTPQLEAKIDLKTGQYTCISGGYNSWGK